MQVIRRDNQDRLVFSSPQQSGASAYTPNRHAWTPGEGTEPAKIIYQNSRNIPHRIKMFGSGAVKPDPHSFIQNTINNKQQSWTKIASKKFLLTYTCVLMQVSRREEPASASPAHTRPPNLHEDSGHVPAPGIGKIRH
jgi:hypothetical protein